MWSWLTNRHSSRDRGRGQRPRRGLAVRRVETARASRDSYRVDQMTAGDNPALRLYHLPRGVRQKDRLSIELV